MLAAIVVVAAFIGGGCQKRIPRPGAPSPRIVAYSPALAEIVIGVGLGDYVVGLTSGSPLPPGEPPAVVGDAISVNIEAIAAVRPDLLLTQSRPDMFEPLRRLDPNVRIEYFSIETVGGLADALERVGLLAGRPDLGAAAKQRFETDIENLSARVRGLDRPKVLFVMDHLHPFTGGKGTFLDEMISLAGGTNAAARAGWHSMNVEDILAARPDVLICQSVAASARSAGEYFAGLSDLPAASSRRVFVVTDAGWTIPSPRVAQYVSKLADMIHPQPTGASRP